MILDTPFNRAGGFKLIHKPWQLICQFTYLYSDPTFGDFVNTCFIVSFSCANNISPILESDKAVIAPQGLIMRFKVVEILSRKAY